MTPEDEILRDERLRPVFEAILHFYGVKGDERRQKLAQWMADPASFDRAQYDELERLGFWQRMEERHGAEEVAQYRRLLGER